MKEERNEGKIRKEVREKKKGEEIRKKERGRNSPLHARKIPVTFN